MSLTKFCPNCGKSAEGRIVCAFCGTNLLQYRVKDKPKAPETPKTPEAPKAPEDPKAPEAPKKNMTDLVRALAPFVVKTNSDGVTYTIVKYKDPDVVTHGIFIANPLKHVEIPEVVTAIANRAFSYTKLTSVAIPASVKHIGAHAFSNCRFMTHVNISEGVESIGAGAFRNCNSLGNVTIPETMKSIGHNAFRGCTALTRVDAPERFLECFVNLS